MPANSPHHEDLNRHIIRALDAAIAEGQWDKGLFMRVIGKRLTNLRDCFAQELVLQAADPALQPTAQLDPSVDAKTRQVYVMLYHADGEKIENWLPMLRDLSHFSIGRPVYTSEQDAQTFLRAKRNPLKNAYVIADVDREACIEGEKGMPRHDKDGRAVLLLKKGSLRTEAVRFFVHHGGYYRLQESGLQSIDDA